MPSFLSRPSRLVACAMLLAFAGGASAQTPVRLLAREGDPVPGGGVFADGNFGVTVAGPNGTVVFQGIATTGRGIWMSDGTTLTKIVQTGDPVPPGVPGVVYGDQPGFVSFGLINADDLGNVVFEYTSSRVLHTPSGVSILPSNTGVNDFALRNGRIAYRSNVPSVGQYVSRGPIGGPYEEFYAHNMTIGGFGFGYDKARQFGAARMVMDDAGNVPGIVTVNGPGGNCAVGSYMFPLGGAPLLRAAGVASCYPGSPFPSGTAQTRDATVVSNTGRWADTYPPWSPAPGVSMIATRDGSNVFSHPLDTDSFRPSGASWYSSPSLRAELIDADGNALYYATTSDFRNVYIEVLADGSLVNAVPYGASFPELPGRTITQASLITGSSETGRQVYTLRLTNGAGSHVFARATRVPGGQLRLFLFEGGTVQDADTGVVWNVVDSTFIGNFLQGPGASSTLADTGHLFASLRLQRTVPPFNLMRAVVEFDLNDLDPPCPSDVNGDTESDILDFLDFIDSFGTCENQPAPCAGSSGIEADFNGDTSVDILDFLDFFDAFGTGCD